MRERTSMVAKGKSFYAEVAVKSTGNKYYFKSSRVNNVSEFMETIKQYFAENIDPADAFNLEFPRITNVAQPSWTEVEKFVEL